MIPGELFLEANPIEANTGRRSASLIVRNDGDRPIQVGSHYHFYETNPALTFEREPTRGMHLDIPAGTAVRFEPGEQKTVQLVEYGGDQFVLGHRGVVNGRP